MDYKTWKYLNGLIIEDILKCRIIFLYKNGEQNTFYLFFREGFNHFICILSFSLNLKSSKHMKRSYLTYKVLPFTPDDVIINLSSYKISHEEANILKYGLGNSIPSAKLSRTDIFVSFDLIHRYLTEELKSKVDKSSQRSNLSHQNSYYSN